MRVVVFGARGTLGSRVVRELLRRNHTVRVVARPGTVADGDPVRMPTVIADVTRPSSVTEAIRGADVVVSAIGPDPGEAPSVITEAARALLAGARQAGVARLIVVGGAGSLEVSPGVQLLDSAGFPSENRPVALAHREALTILRAESGIEWTVVSPAATVEPGARTGHYRAGGDQLVTDAAGRSHISAEDFAVAIVDEIEEPRHVRRRFTVASL